MRWWPENKRFRLAVATVLVTSILGIAAVERPEVQLSLPYSDFASFQGTVTRAEVEGKIARYLMKTPGSDIEQYYSVTDEEFSLFESPEKKAKGVPEFTLYLAKGKAGEMPVRNELGRWRPSRDPKKPLQGLRVALDPGHLGGEIAGYRKPEDRYIWMKDSGLQFDEGTLVYLTAKKLEELLVADGASVLLTRHAIGEGAEGIPYSYWKKTYFEEDLNQYLLVNYKTEPERERARAAILDPNAPTGPYKVLSWRDLRLRAQKMNAFAPDLTLILHYNTGSVAKGPDGRDVGYPDNFLMTFVPGSFMNGELVDQPSRYHFLRLIVTDDIRESQAFSREVLSQLVHGLRVDSVPAGAQFPYLVNGSLMLEPGVYARNLGLTRLTKGRLCYSEPLFQDNVAESERLARKDAMIDGVATSSRLIEVAEGYHQAILEMARRAR